MSFPVPDWWRHDETPDELYARAMWHFNEHGRLVALLPTDYFDSSMVRRHGDLLRGEELEASEIEGVMP
jgi:hypothetical protein